MNSESQLQGKVAIVTGGSRGIGLAIASALLRRGAAVTITGRDKEHLQRAVEKLRGEGQVEGVQADVRDPSQVDQSIARTVERFGGIDILVNNAAAAGFANVADETLAHWREIIDTNLTGVFLCSHAVIPHLRRRGGGYIINISSLAGKNSFVGASAYCASKAGLNSFSEVLMLEVRYDNIRVSCIMPGSVQTEFGGHDAGPQAEWKSSPDDIAQVVIDLISMSPRSLPSRVEIRPSKPKKG